MFFNTLQKTLRYHRKEASGQKWIGFKQYPRLEFLKEMREVAEQVKDRSLNDGFFKAGRFVYPDFARTLVGKSIFAIANNNFLDVVRLAPRGYAAANKYGKAEVSVPYDNCVQLSLENVWDPMPFSAGICQGVLDLFHIDPIKFEVEQSALAHVTFRITY